MVWAPDGPTVFITGANRGIGLEFARQYAADGWRVIATCRTPAAAEALNALAEAHDNLVVEQLDVTDHGRIEALAEQLKAQPIDLLLNNAAMLGELPEQTFGSLSYDAFQQVMAVNVFGPLRLAEALVEQVAVSEQKKIVALTSGLGSMTLTTRMGRFYNYRSSKAALNMAMRALRADLRERGIVVGLVSPGMVQTRMLAASGYRGPALTSAESVSGMRAVIAAMNSADDGVIVNHDGEVIPW
jgi:NAD(P)-dependent dehydrogenase (short-subunit alcohol dehydrogenase family)